MKRFLLALLAAFYLAIPLSAQEGTLPAPKTDWKSSFEAGIDEVSNGKPKPKDCCDFLCDIFILNNSGTKLKGWIKATLIGVPGHVEIPGHCQPGGIVTAHPCKHPWHLWFDEIRISVWDGEQSASVHVPFYHCCCKRRYVAEYHRGVLKLIEK